MTGLPNAPVNWALVSGPGMLSNEQQVKSGILPTATLTADNSGSGEIVVMVMVDGQDYDCTVKVRAVGLATNADISKRINQIIKDIERSGNEGIGKPEPLKENLTDFWSRRIDERHRLVYRIREEIGIFR